MSASSHETLIRDYIEAVFNRHELDDLGSYWTEDLSSHWMGQETLHGLPAWREAMADFFTAFPDITYSLDDLFFTGDRGVWRGPGAAPSAATGPGSRHPARRRNGPQ